MKTSIAVTLSLALSTAAFASVSAVMDNAARAMQGCLAVTDADRRLACYDQAAQRFAPPTFAGRLSQTTKKFTISQPHRLRYHSEGVIFVLYLKQADGKVVKNMNLGGGGTGSYLIARPGTYFLQVNGSAKWKIWLEPVAADPMQDENRIEP